MTRHQEPAATPRPARTIAILTDEYVDYQRAIIDSVSGLVARAGYRTLCFAGGALGAASGQDAAPLSSNEIFRLAERGKFAGIVALTGGLIRHVDLATLTRFLQRFDVPMVSLGVAVEGVPSIVGEDQRGMHELMGHLLANQDRHRFAFLRGFPNDRYSLERETIFRDCLASAGRSIDEALFPAGNYDAYEAYNAVRDLLQNHPDVDVIVAANDQMALSAARAADSLSLRIPEDIAIAGFDDSSEATEHSPALTTVRKPLIETAETGVARLLQLIAEVEDVTATAAAARSNQTLVTLLHSTLVVRRSTPCLMAVGPCSVAARLKEHLITSMAGLDQPDNVDLADVADALLETVHTGSPRLAHCLAVVQDSCRDRAQAHWLRDLYHRIESLAAEALHSFGRPDDIVRVRGMLFPLRKTLWANALAMEFDGHRMGQAQSSLQVQIGSCTRLDDMLEVLDGWLACASPQRFFLVHYDQPDASVPPTARLIRAVGAGTIEKPVYLPFKTVDLLPQPYLANLEQSHLVIYPIVASDRHFGYMMLEPLGLEQRYIDDIVHSLGNAMHSQWLIETLESQAAALKGSNTELDRLANYDELTGLPNRRYFERRLASACDSRNCGPRTFAVLFMDLDGFKLVNDTLGHACGDSLLQQVATRLTATADDLLGSRGFIARLSGDEFTVMIGDTDEPEIRRVCTALLDTLRQTYSVDEHRINVSASIGYACCPDDASGMTSLLRHADAAMYHAKASGKNRFVRAERSMVSQGATHLKLAQDLRTALDRHELSLYYQPRIDLATQTMRGVEALSRWFEQTPDGPRPKATPAEFIPVAEQSGLIFRLDSQALCEACRQARAWSDAGTPLQVSINVSVLQLQQNDFIEQVRRAMETHGTDPSLLELEITESAMMTDIEENIQKLALLRQLGVHVSIDDFGTGYSSLSYLKRLPVNCLKVDRSFIKDIHGANGAGSADAALVRSIVALARSMQFSVVAEGIETDEQRRFIIDSGFDEGQGYYFGKPQSADEISELLQDVVAVAA